jgi:hypothetical protein
MTEDITALVGIFVLLCVVAGVMTALDEQARRW